MPRLSARAHGATLAALLMVTAYVLASGHAASWWHALVFLSPNAVASAFLFLPMLAVVVLVPSFLVGAAWTGISQARPKVSPWLVGLGIAAAFVPPLAVRQWGGVEGLGLVPIDALWLMAVAQLVGPLVAGAAGGPRAAILLAAGSGAMAFPVGNDILRGTAARSPGEAVILLAIALASVPLIDGLVRWSAKDPGRPAVAPWSGGQVFLAALATLAWAGANVAAAQPCDGFGCLDKLVPMALAGGLTIVLVAWTAILRALANGALRAGRDGGPPATGPAEPAGGRATGHAAAEATEGAGGPGPG